MYIRKRFYSKDCLKVAEEEVEYAKGIFNRAQICNNKYTAIKERVLYEAVKACEGQPLAPFTVEDDLFKELLPVEQKKMFQDFIDFVNYSSKGILPKIEDKLIDNECREWIGKEVGIYKAGENQEKRVRENISVYTTTFKPENCLFNAVLKNYIGDRNRTRESDGILVTDVGIYVLEIKSYRNVEVTDDNRIIKKDNSVDNKAVEQVARNIENIKTILTKNNISMDIIPLAVVSDYSYINTEQGFVTTPEGIYNEYTKRRNSKKKEDLYDDKLIQDVIQIIKSEELHPLDEVEYVFDSDKNEYVMRNNNGFPSFAKILLNRDEANEFVVKFENFLDAILMNEEYIKSVIEYFIQVCSNVNAKKTEEEKKEKWKKKREKIIVISAIGGAILTLVLFFGISSCVKSQKAEQQKIEAEQKRELQKKQEEELEKKRVEEIKAKSHSYCAKIAGLSEDASVEDIKNNLENDVKKRYEGAEIVAFGSNTKDVFVVLYIKDGKYYESTFFSSMGYSVSFNTTKEEFLKEYNDILIYCE